MLEVMIALAIVAILTAIAYPQYSRYVTNAKLGEAMNALSTYSVTAQQYYADNRQYPNPCGATSGTPPFPTMKYFTLANCTMGSGSQSATYQVEGLAGAPTANFSYQITVPSLARASDGPAPWAQSSTTCWIASPGQCQ